MTEFPLSWRKDAPDHWSASVNKSLTLAAWPKVDGAWVWEIMKGEDVEESGQGTSRRDAMGKAEAEVRKMLPIPTDVQIVTGWLAHRSEVPPEVLQAAMRMCERDKAERKARKPDPQPDGRRHTDGCPAVHGTSQSTTECAVWCVARAPFQGGGG